MPQGHRASNCSAGVPIDFYWHACAGAEDHVEAAVAALWAALQVPGRRWNPWTSAMVKSELRNRINAAVAGELEPVDEVKQIANGDVLFEIRWNDVSVTDVNADGNVVHHETGVRFLHAEPLALSLCAVGLHAHEKPYNQDPLVVKEAQNREIEVALQRYHAGVGTLWGFGSS